MKRRKIPFYIDASVGIQLREICCRKNLIHIVRCLWSENLLGNFYDSLFNFTAHLQAFVSVAISSALQGDYFNINIRM